MSSLIV